MNEPASFARSVLSSHEVDERTPGEMTNDAHNALDNDLGVRLVIAPVLELAVVRPSVVMEALAQRGQNLYVCT